MIYDIKTYYEKYDVIEIIERIKKEMNAIIKDKSNDISSQDVFFEKKVNYSKQSLSNCKKNKMLPPFDVMLQFCNAFNCEIGYLLGEYPEKQRIQDILKTECLFSRDAINYLLEHGKDSVVEYDNTKLLIPDIEDKEEDIKKLRYDSYPESRRFINVLNMIIEECPELIASLGEIISCEELWLEKMNDEKKWRKVLRDRKYEPYEKILKFAIQLKHYCSTRIKIEKDNISDKEKHDFTVDLLKLQFKELRNANEELYRMVYDRPRY